MVTDYDTKTVTMTEAEYQKLLEKQATLQTSLDQLVEFRAWLLEEKGVEDLDAGLRLCTSAELWTWLQKSYGPLGMWMPMSVAEEAARRVMDRDAAIIERREAELLKLYHIDPWEGK